MALQRSGLRVQGLTGIIANLRAFDPDCTREIRRAVRQGGEETRELAKQFCPIDTALLYSSIEDNYSPSGLAFTVGCNPEAFEAAGVEPYDKWVEFGTEASPAQPFLTPAFEAMRPHIEADIRAALRTSIARAGR